MKKIFRPFKYKLIIAISVMCALLLVINFLSPREFKPAMAGSGDKVTGYAWSENVGWVSFNCSDGNSCSSIDYGVDINTGTGDLSGYAWSENVGWISFNRKTCNSGTDRGKSCILDSDCSASTCQADGPGATGNPPAEPFLSDQDKIANFDSSTGKIRGWAKILSLGESGWISMGNLSGGETIFPLEFPLEFPIGFGVDSFGVSIATSTGEWSGWAWNGNDSDEPGIGWLSFNCSDTDSCATSNYKVVSILNVAPSVDNLSAPNWSYEQACALYARQAILRWRFTDPDIGSSQSAYQIIIDDDADMSAPLFDSGKATTSASQFSAGPTILNYDQTYYWWVRVWDNNDSVSDYAAGPSFTTYKHELPHVDFSYSPTSPSVGEEIQFTDDSSSFGGTSISERLWTSEGASIQPSATSTNPVITPDSSGNYVVNLKVTDSDGYYCDLDKTIRIGAVLPSWREVKPK